MSIKLSNYALLLPGDVEKISKLRLDQYRKETTELKMAKQNR